MWINCATVCAKSLLLCLTFCNAMGCTLPVCPWDSSGKNTGMDCQACSRGSSLPRDQTHAMSPTMAGSFCTTSETWESQILYKCNQSLGTSLVAQRVKNLLEMQETWIWSLCLEDSPKEGNIYPLKYTCLENSMNRNYSLQGCKETWLSD